MTLVSVGSDNGLSPVRGQAIIGTNIDLLSMGAQGAEFSKISMEIKKKDVIHKIAFENICHIGGHPNCSGLNVLNKAMWWLT